MDFVGAKLMSSQLSELMRLTGTAVWQHVLSKQANAVGLRVHAINVVGNDAAQVALEPCCSTRVRLSGRRG
jgi:hypothetical protein